MSQAADTRAITYLFQQQITVGREARDQVFGEVQERAQHFKRKVIPGGTLQHERDDEKASVLDHVLLHSLTALH